MKFKSGLLFVPIVFIASIGHSADASDAKKNAVASSTHTSNEVIMQIVPKQIFDEFKARISDPLYHPKDPIETLKARLTATWLLSHPDPQIVSQAEALIQKTSRFREEDLARLRHLSSQVKTWDELRLISTYTNTLGTFLEYQLSFTLDGGPKILHFHAQYEIEDKWCCFISQTAPLIRVVGDPVLHQPGVLFPENPKLEETQALIDQIDHAKSILVQTSGGGIAANQCAGIGHPYRFVITGIFYEIPGHVAGVARRYPNAKFPQAAIMVNPVITSVSQETQGFNHACLSVPCGNRCAVRSPMEINVTYQDPFENMQTKQVRSTGMDAVVLWHELTHILEGKTYMDITFESLPSQDLIQFKNMLHHEIQRRQEARFDQLPDLTVPPFHFSVKTDENGMPRLDPQELADVLPKLTDETLAGLFSRASQL